MDTAIIHERSLSEIEVVAQTFLRATIAPATWRSYRQSCQHFGEWCQRHGLSPLPADERTIALYLADIASEYSVSTICARLAGINAAHLAYGAPSIRSSEAVRRVWKGIRRSKGIAQQRKAALVTEQIAQIVAGLPDTMRGKRNKVLILLGFMGAFRRGELMGVEVQHLQFCAEGVVVTLPRSKTDQQGSGYVKGIPFGKNPATCPVRALRDWLDSAGITEGPVFRPVDRNGHVRKGGLTDQSVALIVKEAAAAAGLSGDYSGLSLRAGFATAAVQAGETMLNIMRQTGHKQPSTLMRYVRHVNVWKDNPASGIEL